MLFRSDDVLSSGLSGDSGDAGSRSILSCMHKAFISPTGQNLSDALSRLAEITNDRAFAPASHMTCREAAREGLLPVEGDDLYFYYTETERMFLSMSTEREWTQNEAREVLEMLLDPKFRTEDLSTDVLQRVRHGRHYAVITPSCFQIGRAHV